LGRRCKVPKKQKRTSTKKHMKKILGGLKSGATFSFDYQPQTGISHVNDLSNNIHTQLGAKSG